MGKSPQGVEKQPLAERGSRFLRDINILGAVALGGAAVIFPEFSVPLWTLAGINVVQAVFFEATRRLSARRTDAKPKPAPA